MASRQRRISVLSLYIIILLAVSGVIGSTGVVAATPSENTAGSEATASTAGSENVTIDRAIQQSTGETTALVRFAGPRTANDTASSNGTPHGGVSTMRARAGDMRVPFERAVATWPAVEINQVLWVIDAVVVTVDTDAISIDRLARVANVTAIHSTTTIQTAAARQDTPRPDRRPPPPQTARTVEPTASHPGSTQSTALTATAEASNSLETIRVPGTWELYGTRGGGVRVAVLDTGVDPEHPDISLAADGWAEFDTRGVQVDSTPYDPNGHGTHVSGTVAGGNQSGTAIGVAPAATLLHAKTFDENGSGTFRQIAAGVQWAIENDADVISMSFSANTKRDESFADLVATAEAAGVTVVAASGNNGPNTSSAPGDVYEVLTLGAATGDGDVALFSSGEVVARDEWSTAPGTWPAQYVVPDAVAPGVEVLSAVPTGEYARFQGTSMATPHAAGVAALVIAAESTTEPSGTATSAAAGEQLVPTDIRTTIAETAVDLGAASTRQGAGRIDAYRAVTRVGTPTCGRVSYPGRIELRQNLTGTDGCLVIASDDVIIDGNGQMISGTGAAIELRGERRSNVTIRNVTFEETGRPVVAENGTAVSALTIRNVRINQTGGPVSIEGNGPVTVESTRITGGQGEIRLKNASQVTMTNVTITGVEADGVTISGATETTATALTVRADRRGVSIQDGKIELTDSDVHGTTGPGLTVEAASNVSLRKVRMGGAPPLRITGENTALAGTDLTVGSVAGIDLRGAALIIAEPTATPPAPENKTAVTDRIELRNLSAPVTLIMPYDLVRRPTATVTLSRYAGTNRTWPPLETTQNQTAKTVTASIGVNGIVRGYVAGDVLDPYRTAGQVDTGGLLDGIADWRAGRLSTGELLTLISEWRADRR
jgi:subtilisin family serine protease